MLLSTGACDQACTEAGCNTLPVEVVFLGPNWGPLPARTYDVTLDLDGATIDTTCTTGVDGSACEPPTVTGDLEVQTYVTSGDRIVVAFGTDNPADLPTSYRAQAFSGSQPLIEVSGELTYAETHPNGPDCSPTCRASDGAFVVVE